MSVTSREFGEDQLLEYLEDFADSFKSLYLTSKTLDRRELKVNVSKEDRMDYNLKNIRTLVFGTRLLEALYNYMDMHGATVLGEGSPFAFIARPSAPSYESDKLRTLSNITNMCSLVVKEAELNGIVLDMKDIITSEREQIYKESK